MRNIGGKLDNSSTKAVVQHLRLMREVLKIYHNSQPYFSRLNPITQRPETWIFSSSVYPQLNHVKLKTSV
ncbi:unnamed protein product [Rhizophagus irregularis]|nr:unnamed protein product [Rhizophagus irregularis]CAB5367107.1 unnamed protein product [Rhizophagus irregularis]